MRTSARARRWRPVLILAALAALLLPSVSQVAAADPVVLRVGETQDVTAINPYLATLFSDYEVFTLNYDLLVGYGPDEEPAPGFAKSWVQDGNTWTFKIDPGLTWSDGTPATAEDARWTIQSLLDGQAVDPFYVGSGYLDAYLTYAGVKKVSVARRADAGHRDRDPQHADPDLVHPHPAQAHLGEAQDRRRCQRRTGRRHRAIPGGRVEARRVRPPRAQPHYWGTQGYADEIFIQYFADESAMTEALKAGTIDYARNPTADQFDSLQGLPDTVPVHSATASEANAFTELGFNTYSKPIKGGGASTTALQDPKFRDALGYAIDKQVLVDKVLKGKGVVGSTHHPAGPWRRQVAHRAERRADVRHRGGQAEAGGGGLYPRRQRQAARQGAEADRAAHGRARYVGDATRTAPSSSPTGGSSWAST